jgi:TonB family protein
MGGRELAMAQRYLPEIRDGDKRILLVDGEPVPYCLARIPQGDEFRGNLAAGGRGEGRPLSERDRWIAAAGRPGAARRGMLFVGLDVIGDYLTEVNVTSPTCIRELDAQFGLNIAGQRCSTRSRPAWPDLAMARLAAEIHMRTERYAKRPKRKFVSASTREYAYAGYLREWVDRVERIGNLNYPDEARRRRLAGQLVISVAIRRDGSVERADVIESSGQRLLDDAALRIARLAEPYPPLPRTDDDIDILHVTRTWQFLPGGELVDR